MGTLKLREGAYYKNRRGDVRGPLRVRVSDTRPWDDGELIYYPQGQLLPSALDAADLISECDKDGNPIPEPSANGSPFAGRVRVGEIEYFPPGISRRDWFAGMALMALVPDHSPLSACRFACQYADSLIAELDKHATP